MIFHSADDLHLNSDEWFMSGGAVSWPPCRRGFNALALTPTWLNSINPQRSLATTTPSHLNPAPFLFHFAGDAPASCFTLCNILKKKEKKKRTNPNEGSSAMCAPCLLVTTSSRLLAPRLDSLLTAAAEEAVITELGEASPNALPPPPNPVLMTNQNEKWRRGRAWFVLHAKYGL